MLTRSHLNLISSTAELSVMPYEEFVRVTFLILSDSWMTHSIANSQSNAGHFYAMWLFIFPTIACSHILFHIKLLICITDIISFLHSHVSTSFSYHSVWNEVWTPLQLNNYSGILYLPTLGAKEHMIEITLTYIKGSFLISIPLPLCSGWKLDVLGHTQVKQRWWLLAGAYTWQNQYTLLVASLSLISWR